MIGSLVCVEPQWSLSVSMETPSPYSPADYKHTTAVCVWWCHTVALIIHLSETLTRSPRQASLLLVVTLVALTEVEQDKHVQHHPHQRGGQHHLTVGKSPHPWKGERQRKGKHIKRLKRMEEEERWKVEVWTEDTNRGFAVGISPWLSLSLLVCVHLPPHSLLAGFLSICLLWVCQTDWLLPVIYQLLISTASKGHLHALDGAE